MISRRNFLQNAACGFGSLAFHSLAQATSSAVAPIGTTHFPARAKRVIFLFMAGGPSQPDLFDPKAYIEKKHGQKVTPPIKDHQLRTGVEKFLALAPGAPVRPRGECGMMISDLLPHMASVADDLCLLRAMQADNKSHPQASLQMHTGAIAEARPSMGSWIGYGLGSENDDLPAYLTIHPQADVRTYGSGFLPASFQGTPLTVPKDDKALAIQYLTDPEADPARQRSRLDLLQGMNRRLLQRYQTEPQMEGLISSFEMAYRMQASAPELVDLSGESKATLDLYGIGEGKTDRNGKACLLARRLSEAGVRFVQVTIDGWDHHGDIRTALPNSCAGSDKPVAGLIKDLKSRGMLDDTLVVWTGEFGRSPWSQDLSGTSPIEKHGREHQQESFCSILAGGGIKPGLTYGKTDDFGFLPVSGKIHLHDLHATILHQLGLNHEELTYRHAGRDYRLTDVYGRVVEEILA
ncbi:MAG: hypothetical protein ACI9R3_002594 [Verrucomicrobiales bacterium]|jgi:hypothetical protein